MKNNFDIAIAYRIYPGISKIPPVYSDDKLKLSELCLYSFKQSLGNLKIKIFALLDNCPDSYVQLFNKYFDSEELEILRYNGIGNAGTFEQQIKILLYQDFSENIYFAEDDYFYLPNAIPMMLNLIKSRKDADFITSYYHPDYDSMKFHKDFESNQIIMHNYTWQTVATTTMTFLTTKTKLKETERTFLSYLKNNYDASIWLSLTKYKVKNFFNIFKYMYFDKLWFKILLKSWIFTSGQINGGKKYHLLVPVRTLSTHMDSLCLSPGEDWFDHFTKIKEKINFNS